MEKIQILLIRYLLQPLANIMKHFSVQVREMLFTVAGVMIFLAYFANANGKFASPRYLFFFAFNCFMFGLMILALMPTKIQPVRFDKVLLTPWLIMGIFILIAGVTKGNEDILPEAALFLIGYPVFYIISAGCNFQRLLQLLFRVVYLSFALFLFISLIFFPISGDRYEGLFHNTNGIAFYLVLVFSCSMIDLLSTRKKYIYACSFVMAGLSAALIFYSTSRTGLLSIFSAFVLTLLLTLLMDRNRVLKTLAFRFLPIVLSVVIFIPSTIYIFEASQMVMRSITEWTKLPELTIPTDKDSSPDPDATPVPEPAPDLGHTWTNIVDANNQKTTFEGKDLNSYSTGRIAIWLGYLPLLTFWGHAEKADVYVTETRHYTDAHQTVLQITYESGLLAGLCYLLFNILAGLKSIRYALRRPENYYALAPFAISITFGVLLLLATCYASFYCMTTFYYYLVQSPLMVKGDAARVL